MEIQTPINKHKQYMDAYVLKVKDIRFDCVCGVKYGYFNKSHHMKSRHHINTMAILEKHGINTNQ